MKVLITPRGFARYGLKQIKEMEDLGYEVHYNDTGLAYTHEEFLELSKDVDGIIVGVDTMDKAMIESCSNLKAICKFGVGTDNIDLKVCEEKNIAVGRTVGSNSLSVAEHMISMLLAMSKNLYQSIDEVKEYKWNKLTGQEVADKTIGIIGYGAIGRHLGRLAHGLGMNVLVYDMFPINEPEGYVEIVDFETILTQSDVLSLHVPLTEDTHNLLASPQFKKMKTNAILLNGARGNVVNESDLYEALLANEIKGACFDVLEFEPPINPNPLLQLDNFYLTPHTASRTEEAEIRTCELSKDFIVKHLGGN